MYCDRGQYNTVPASLTNFSKCLVSGLSASIQRPPCNFSFFRGDSVAKRSGKANEKQKIMELSTAIYIEEGDNKKSPCNPDPDFDMEPGDHCKKAMLKLSVHGKSAGAHPSCNLKVQQTNITDICEQRSITEGNLLQRDATLFCPRCEKHEKGSAFRTSKIL